MRLGGEYMLPICKDIKGDVHHYPGIYLERVKKVDSTIRASEGPVVTGTG
jgi:hypothetical protein